MEKIEWLSPQYIHTEKTRDWYWVVGIITLTIALVAIILNNPIFAVLIVVSSFTLSLFASRKPEIMENTLDSDGLRVGKMLYPYDHMESFFVETADKYPRLILKLKQRLSQYVTVLIDPDDAEDIKIFLRNHIKEEKLTESIIEKFLIYFGF